MTDSPNTTNLSGGSRRVVELDNFDPAIFVRESEALGYKLVARIVDGHEDSLSERVPIGPPEGSSAKWDFHSALWGWLRSDPEGIDKLWRYLLEAGRWEYYDTAKGTMTLPMHPDKALGGWH